MTQPQTIPTPGRDAARTARPDAAEGQTSAPGGQTFPSPGPKAPAQNRFLVLEGGGMRGVFTAGVLDWMLDHKLEFEGCVGVSAGACQACSFLAHQRGRGFHTVADYLKDKHYCGLYSLLTTGDIFGVKMAYDDIPNRLYPFDYAAYDRQLEHTRFFAAVTNCETGLAEYPLLGDMHKDIIYVRASSSLPLVSRMVQIGGRPYLDGGVADSIPLAFARSKGADRAVVVLTRPRGYRKKPSALGRFYRLRYRRYPALARALENRWQMYNRQLDEIEAAEEKGEIFVIRPEADLGVGRIERNRLRLAKAYRQGYRTAAACAGALADYLR